MANHDAPAGDGITAVDLIETYGERLLAGNASIEIRELGANIETCRQIMAVADIAREFGWDSFSFFLDSSADSEEEPAAGGLGVRFAGWGDGCVSVTADALYGRGGKPSAWAGSRSEWEAEADRLLEQVGELFRCEVTSDEGERINERCGERTFSSDVGADAVMRAVFAPATMAAADARRLAKAGAKPGRRRMG